jgi:hypothetical protein
MSDIEDLFNHPDDFPLGFFDPQEESKVTDNQRSAFVHAAVEAFVLEIAKKKAARVDVDSIEITDAHKALASEVVFLGPFAELKESVRHCVNHNGVLVAPTLLWKKKKVFVYVACLGN